MKHWPTWRCAECLNIHCSLGEIASDIGARPILGELLYSARLLAGATMHAFIDWFNFEAWHPIT